MVEDHPEDPFTLFVRRVDESRPTRHPDDVHDAVERAELRDRLLDDAVDGRALAAIRDARDPADLRRDLGRPLAVDVDAQDPGALLSQRVRGLAPHAQPRADHDETPAVEAQPVGKAGNRGVVGTGHRASSVLGFCSTPPIVRPVGQNGARRTRLFTLPIALRPMSTTKSTERGAL